METTAEKITNSELEVMRVLWEAGDALTITEIRQTLQEHTVWESNTIKTLVQRLCTKGAVLQEKRNVFYYSPLVSEQEYNDWAIKNLLHKLYRGNAKELVAALVHSEELTEADVDELRELFKVEDDK